MLRVRDLESAPTIWGFSDFHQDSSGGGKGTKQCLDSGRLSTSDSDETNANKSGFAQPGGVKD